MISRAIADNGLPLKIQTEWTENDYWEMVHPDSDDMRCVPVKGWLVRINGRKFPRGALHWYRYMCLEAGRCAPS